MLNPVMCLCPICGIVMNLQICNWINRLTVHIATSHPSEKDVISICLKLEQPLFQRKADVKIPVAPIAEKCLSGLKKQLPEELKVPRGTHYLAFWLNHILTQDIIEPPHLTYQEFDALVEIILRYPNPAPARQGWKKWPTLATYVQKIGAAFSRHAVKLYLGTHQVGNNTLDGLKSFVGSVNHAGPSLTTIDSWKPPLQLVSGPNHLTTLLHLKVLIKQQEKSPNISNEKVTRFPGVLCYDEQEINQGVFPVDVDGDLKLAGLLVIKIRNLFSLAVYIYMNFYILHPMRPS